MASVPLPLLQSGAVKFTAPWFDRYRLRPCPNKKRAALRRALETVILFLPGRLPQTGQRSEEARYQVPQAGQWDMAWFSRRVPQTFPPPGRRSPGQAADVQGQRPVPSPLSSGSASGGFPGWSSPASPAAGSAHTPPAAGWPHRQGSPGPGQVLKP